MIDSLYPGGEFGVEFLQAVGGVAFQAESGFKTLLESLDQPLDLSLAPTVIRFAVQQADAQLSADQMGVSIDEGFALISVEFARQAPTQDGFLQSMMQRLRVGLGVISGEGDEPGMVID